VFVVGHDPLRVRPVAVELAAPDLGFDLFPGHVRESDQMADRVAGKRDWVLQDADDEAGEGGCDDPFGCLEVVGDGTDRLPRVNERVRPPLHLDEPARVGPQPAGFLVGAHHLPPGRLDDGPVVAVVARQYALDAGQRLLDEAGLASMGLAHLDGDRRRPVPAGGGAKRGGLTFTREDDVRPERVGQLPDCRIRDVRPGVVHRRPVARRGVNVEAQLRRCDELPVPPVRDPFGRRRSLTTRERPIEVLIVDRQVPLLGLLARHGDDVDQHERPTDRGGVVAGGDHLEQFALTPLSSSPRTAVITTGGPSTSPLTTVTGTSTGSSRYVSLTSWRNCRSVPAGTTTPASPPKRRAPIIPVNHGASD
jgi:hypothetical protein